MNNKIIITTILLSTSTFAATDNVAVQSVDGTVYINGSVNSDNQAIILDKIVNSMSIDRVDMENLNIGNSETPIPDDMITAKINGGFMRAGLFGSNANFDNITIKVETDDGIVYLSGTAASQQQIDNAISIARLVAGVKEVDSDVTIKEETPS